MLPKNCGDRKNAIQKLLVEGCSCSTEKSRRANITVQMYPECPEKLEKCIV